MIKLDNGYCLISVNIQSLVFTVVFNSHNVFKLLRNGLGKRLVRGVKQIAMIT